MMSSSSNVDHEKIINVVMSSTKNLLSSLQEKNALLKQCSKYIKSFIREGYDKKIAYEVAMHLFGKDKTNFIAIDGTESQDQQLDMLVFYAGAFGYSGKLEFSKLEGCTYSEPYEIETTSNISAAISIHEQDATSIAGQLKEGGIEIDSEKIPSSLMQLAEYYMAVKTTMTNPDIQVVILDRTLAGDVAHLVWSVKELLDSGKCILQGMNTEFGNVSSLDLELSRMLHPNDGLQIPVARSHLIKYAAINKLLKIKRDHHDSEKRVTYKDLLLSIGGDTERFDKLKSDLLKFDKIYSIFHNPSEDLNDNELDGHYWERVFSASIKTCEHIFNTPSGEHPLVIDRSLSTVVEHYWVTVADIEYLVLIMIYALLRSAWEKNILVIGLIKDTGASEMNNVIIPLLANTKKIKIKSNNIIPKYGSDKMFLQTASIINSSDMQAPWNTLEFDSCFRTIIPISDRSDKRSINLKNRENNNKINNMIYPVEVKGAFKNVISSERMFLKSYIQLWQSDKDPYVRSHVFSYDRPCYPDFDMTINEDLLLYHNDGQVVEKIYPLLHFSNHSKISHLVMDIMYSMAREVIPECLGHNYPLFLADKKAKSILQEARKAYIAAVSFEMTKNQLDQQVLFEENYREYRSKIEYNRRRTY